MCGLGYCLADTWHILPVGNAFVEANPVGAKDNPKVVPVASEICNLEPELVVTSELRLDKLASQLEAVNLANAASYAVDS